MRNLRYCVSGVWEDSRTLLSVRAVKIVNLSIRSFLDRDLQIRAGSLTYSTVLAVVPALAMLFAIARGFGFQNLIQNELFRYFPSQQQALESASVYVENYLAQASQGIFIGIGLVFLLWTLISLMSNVEDTFNHVWCITAKRSLQRKFTDYTALFLLLPLLMLCSAGITIFMSDAVQHVFSGNRLTPVAHRLLAFTPTVISWIIFTAAFYLVPNTKVSFKGSLFAGVLCGTVFQLLQWLFVTGQVYVSKYNAIYGSFAFLPLPGRILTVFPIPIRSKTSLRPMPTTWHWPCWPLLPSASSSVRHPSLPARSSLAMMSRHRWPRTCSTACGVRG